MIYYLTQKNNPNKHPLIQDDYPWQISSTPSEGWIAVTDEQYQTMINSFDLSEYNKSVTLSQEQIEEGLQLKSAAYTGPGNMIADTLEKKIWARNTYLKSTGQELTLQEMAALLNVSVGVDKALRTGSLLTAKDGISKLKALLPKYADIADWAISALEIFL